MAAKTKMFLVRITTSDAPTMRELVADLALDVSCGGPQSLCTGSKSGGGVSGPACCSSGSARSTREEAVHVPCGIGSWGAVSKYGQSCHGAGGPEGGRTVPEGVHVDYPPERGGNRVVASDGS